MGSISMARLMSSTSFKATPDIRINCARLGIVSRLNRQFTKVFTAGLVCWNSRVMLR